MRKVQQLFYLIYLLNIATNADPCPPLEECRCGRHNDDLTYIYCAKRRLTSVPQLASDNFENHLIFDEFVLSNNLIEQILESSFAKSIYRIKSIDLSDNPIKSIHHTAFLMSAPYLKILKLSFADGVILDKNEFLKPLDMLESLQLRNAILVENVFIPQTIKHLTLQQASLKDNGQFTFLPNDLITLSVDYWDQIDPGSFSSDLSLNWLENLSLMSNGLKTIPTLRPLKSLKFLDLSFNEIYSFNAIRSIKNQFPNLKILKLGYNKLTRKSFIPNNILLGIESLNVDFNDLQVLFTLPKSLKELSARQTSLRSIKQHWFRHAQSLESLNIQTNTKLNDVDCLSFKPIASNLRILNMAQVYTSNGLQVVNCMLEAFDHLSKLESINIRDTKIHFIPKNVRYLRNLRFIDISDNNLNSLDLNLMPKSIYKLFADNITSLNNKPLYLHSDSIPHSLEILSFNDNPFVWVKNTNETVDYNLRTFTANMLVNCNCSASDLAKWSLKHQSSLVYCLNKKQELKKVYSMKCLNDELTSTSTTIASLKWNTLITSEYSYVEWNLDNNSHHNIRAFEVSARTRNWKITSPQLTNNKFHYNITFPTFIDKRVEICLSIYTLNSLERRCRDEKLVKFRRHFEVGGTFVLLTALSLVFSCIYVICKRKSLRSSFHFGRHLKKNSHYRRRQHPYYMGTLKTSWQSDESKPIHLYQELLLDESQPLTK